MTRAPSTPSPARKRLATVIAAVGLTVVGGQLARAWPREVEVAYQPAADVRRLDVDIVQDDEAVTSVRFHRAPDDDDAFFHTVSLQPGEYRARITVYGSDGRGIEHSRPLTVPTDGLTRFDLTD